MRHVSTSGLVSTGTSLVAALIMFLGSKFVLALVAPGTAVFDEARRAATWGLEMVTALCKLVSRMFGIRRYFVS